MQGPRIVSIQTTSERGGAEYANVDLLDALAGRGHDVVLLLKPGLFGLEIDDLAYHPFLSVTIAHARLVANGTDNPIAELGGFKPRISKRAEDLTTVLTYVSLGYGIAAVSPTMANCCVPNVTFKKIASKAAPVVEFAFMYRTNESAPATRTLIEAILRGEITNNTQSVADWLQGHAMIRATVEGKEVF